MKIISFSEFIESVQLDLESFKTNWEDMNKINPSKYPLDLPYEQEIVWVKAFLEQFIKSDLNRVLK